MENLTALRQFRSGGAAAMLLVAGLCGCTTPAPTGARKLANLEYSRAAGRPLRMDLYLPEQAANPLPVLV